MLKETALADVCLFPALAFLNWFEPKCLLSIVFGIVDLFGDILWCLSGDAIGNTLALHQGKSIRVQEEKTPV